MKKKWKIWLAIIGLVVIAVSVLASVSYSQRGIVAVQTGRVGRLDLASLVTASGEIKPRNYINIGANAMMPSRLTEILVKEGDRVRKGQLLARLESVQPEAEVAAQKASLSSSEADSAATESGLTGRRRESAPRPRPLSTGAKADLEQARAGLRPRAAVFQDKLISKQDFDARKMEFDSRVRGPARGRRPLAQVKAQRAQMASQLAAAQKRITLSQANLRRASDVLQRTIRGGPAGRCSDQPARPRRRNRSAGHPELPVQPHHDHRRHVADHRRSQGGRNRHREREAEPGRRHHHRRHP